MKADSAASLDTGRRRAMGRLHALAIPFPAQGHVIPLMELSNLLVERGVSVTFLNTDFVHEQVKAALPEDNSNQKNKIHLVSFPDGLQPGDDRLHTSKLMDSMIRTVPAYLEELIKKINGCCEDKIKYILADGHMGWLTEVAKKMGIPLVVFWPSSAGFWALSDHIPQLLEAGIIDADGTPAKHQMIQVSPSMPPVNTRHFGWNCIGDLAEQRAMFHHVQSNFQSVKNCNWHLFNSFHELERPVFELNPNLSPVGPLATASNQPQHLTGNFWPEDQTCLQWVYQQSPCTVIYVAFGSTAIFDRHQFQELALGLELSGHPFLWVMRSDSVQEHASANYPDGFLARVADRSRIVSWAPQKEVLAHPSIACFITHCGWNSTVEGISNGVPFICWPYFADQPLNQDYISDVWRVGLPLNPNSEGIISREEIKNKVDKVLKDATIRKRALEFREWADKAVKPGGSSMKNIDDFIVAMKKNLSD